MEPLAARRHTDGRPSLPGDIGVINGMRVVASPPGVPPPEGVPPWAFRCEIVEKPNFDLTWRPSILGASVAVIVAGLIATWRGFNWGFAPVPLACVGIWWGLRAGRAGNTIELRAVPDGRYLAFDNREPKDDSGDRALSIIFGVFMLGCAGLPLFAEDGPDWLAAGAFGSFAVGLLYYGMTGRWLSSNEPYIPPSTEQFRALADPRRPLDATPSTMSDGDPHARGAPRPPAEFTPLDPSNHRRFTDRSR